MRKTSIVTAQSSDEAILAAINAAGDNRHLWRRYDWPEEGSSNAKSWVKPGDIGHSSHRHPELLERLRKMARTGLLEERHVEVAVVSDIRDGCEHVFLRPMFPRFRVILK